MFYELQSAANTIIFFAYNQITNKNLPVNLIRL